MMSFIKSFLLRVLGIDKGMKLPKSLEQMMDELLKKENQAVKLT